MYMYGRAEYNYGIQYSAAVQYTEGQIGGVKWSGVGVVGGGGFGGGRKATH